MLDTLRKLKFGARVLLSRGGGQPESVDVNGLAVTLMHAGEGPPFVYLHSTLGESALWLPYYQSLAKQFRVLVPTHPGFNGTPGFDNIDTIEDLAFHYIELFDALGLDEMILGGVSLGGWVAAEIAVRWPERVKKLWLTSAPGLWSDQAELGDLFRIMYDRDAVRRMLFHDPNSHMAKIVLPEEVDEAKALNAYQNLTVLARLVWERPYDPKLARRLHRVKCPTLLLWGAHDALVPPAFAEEYRKHLPHAELKLIADCGHLPMFEKEAEFVDALTRFGKV
jgi:pimeloyl-ACP methyl ester carboxylesterase